MPSTNKSFHYKMLNMTETKFKTIFSQYFDTITPALNYSVVSGPYFKIVPTAYTDALSTLYVVCFGTNQGETSYATPIYTTALDEDVDKVVHQKLSFYIAAPAYSSMFDNLFIGLNILPASDATNYYRVGVLLQSQYNSLSCSGGPHYCSSKYGSPRSWSTTGTLSATVSINTMYTFDLYSYFTVASSYSGGMNVTHRGALFLNGTLANATEQPVTLSKVYSPTSDDFENGYCVKGLYLSPFVIADHYNTGTIRSVTSPDIRIKEMLMEVA